ncbi:2-dehydropantoate 2-reductase [Halopseudomonas sp.]|uniref:2-dehydropantoate 2-reductase n=1 Tax=Halopseudomonas sp. TaxID=2901191 RepID=UPI00311F5342
MLHIIGAGSLGLLWAARLQLGGIACRLILRNSNRQEQWLRNGGILAFNDGATVHTLQLATETPDAPTPIRHLIVATKAYAALPAVESVRHRLQQGAELFLLQNGLGSQQAIADAFPECRVYCISITDGAWRPSEHELTWAGRGHNTIGPLHPATPQPTWLSSLPDSISTSWRTDILPVLWRKLAVNCAINPFTLIYDCRNGDVPERADGWLDQCITELEQLLARQGFDTDLAEQIQAVILATANNSSSTRQDLHARRRTELDYILGYACRAAREADLPTPALDQLLEQARETLQQHQLPAD